MSRASVVLPVPGGPQKMIDCSRSRSIASRSGRPGASSSSWPSISSSVRGRIRSASGTVRGSGGCSGSSKRDDMIARPKVWKPRLQALALTIPEAGGYWGSEQVIRPKVPPPGASPLRKSVRLSAQAMPSPCGSARARRSNAIGVPGLPPSSAEVR